MIHCAHSRGLLAIIFRMPMACSGDWPRVSKLICARSHPCAMGKEGSNSRAGPEVDTEGSPWLMNSVESEELHVLSVNPDKEDELD